MGNYFDAAIMTYFFLLPFTAISILFISVYIDIIENIEEKLELKDLLGIILPILPVVVVIIPLFNILGEASWITSSDYHLIIFSSIIFYGLTIFYNLKILGAKK